MQNLKMEMILEEIIFILKLYQLWKLENLYQFWWITFVKG